MGKGPVTGSEASQQAEGWSGAGCRFFRRLGVAATLCLASCTTYESTLIEFDSFAGFDPLTQEEPATLSYTGEALQYPFMTRFVEGTPFVLLFRDLFGFKRVRFEITEGARFVRERIALLPGLTGKDLDRIAQVTWRLLFVLEADASPSNRVIAAKGLAELLSHFDEGKISPDHMGMRKGLTSTFEASARELIVELEQLWPRKRVDETIAGKREVYAELIAQLSRLETGDLAQERARLRLLLEALIDETMAPVQRRVAGHLAYAVQVALVRGLSQGLEDNNVWVQCACLEGLLQADDGKLYAKLLADFDRARTRMGRSGEQIAVGPIRLGEAMRRQLVQFLGAGPVAQASLRYEKGLSGFELLHEIATTDPEQSLQVFAADTLAWLLRRDADPFGEWIPDWWAAYEKKEASPKKSEAGS